MNDAFTRGFVKAACTHGLPPSQLAHIIKIASSGMLPAMLGAAPGALLGGYMGYDRAQERKKEDPLYSGSPGGAALSGSLLGAGAGGLLGAGAGAVGWERGVGDANNNHSELLRQLMSMYGQA
jgi:hypothetical protein